MPDALTLTRGTARGRTIVLTEPLSFWGGFDAESGKVIDRRHPQCGVVLTGCVILMPSGRGSSSSASVLAEAIRLGTAPAAIVMRERDSIVTIGALVAAELYEMFMPVVVCTPNDYDALAHASKLQVGATEGRARVEVVRPPS